MTVPYRPDNPFAHRTYRKDNPFAMPDFSGVQSGASSAKTDLAKATFGTSDLTDAAAGFGMPSGELNPLSPADLRQVRVGIGAEQPRLTERIAPNDPGIKGTLGDMAEGAENVVRGLPSGAAQGLVGGAADALKYGGMVVDPVGTLAAVAQGRTPLAIQGSDALRQDVEQPVVEALRGAFQPEGVGGAIGEQAGAFVAQGAALKGVAMLREIKAAREAAGALEGETMARIAEAPAANEAFRASRRNAVLARAQGAEAANTAANQGIGKLARAEQRAAVEAEPPSATSQLLRQADAELLAPSAEREARRARLAAEEARAEADPVRQAIRRFRAKQRAPEPSPVATPESAAEPITSEPTAAPIPRGGSLAPSVLGETRLDKLRTIMGERRAPGTPTASEPLGTTRGAEFGGVRPGILGNEQGVLRVAPPAVTEGLPPDVAGAYQRRARAIDFTGQMEKTAAASAKGSLSSRIQRFGDAIANDRGPIERLGTMAEKADPTYRPTQNPKYLLSYQKESSATVERAITEGVPDALSRETVGPSYKSLFQPFGRNDRRIQQALTYAVEKRGVARGVEAYGGDAQAFADAQTLVKHFDADPEMAAFADQLQQYTDALGNYAVQSGRWTPEQWAAIKQSDALYIPYRRIMDSLIQAGGRGAGMGGTGRKLVNITSGVKAFTGSRRALANPAVALAEYTDAIIRGSDAYRVGASLFDAADRLGDVGALLLSPVEGTALPVKARALKMLEARAAQAGSPLDKDVLGALSEMFEPAIDPKHPVIWRNGPNGREYRVVNAPDLYQAVAGMHASPGAVQRFLDMTLLPLRRIFTLTTTAFVPRFAGGTNPARDVLDALAKTQHRVTPLDLGRGYVEALGDVVGAQNVPKYLPALQRAFQRVGVDLSGMPGVSGLAGEAKRHGLGGVSQFGDIATPSMAARRFAPTTLGQRLRGSVRSVALGDRSPLAKLERVFEASDLGPRLGEYAAAKRDPKVVAKLTSGTWTPLDVELYAASAGRPITLDFSNVPGNPILRAYARYVPFVRPALQSPVRFAEATARNPRRMLAYVSGVSAAAAGAWVMKHRSPEVLAMTNDRPDEERAGFLLFPVDDQGHVTLRMPLGQETAVIAAGTTALLDAWADHDPHASDQFVEAMSRALPPGLDEWIKGHPEVPIPGVQQIQENDRNRRFFGNAPVESERLQAVSPEERRYDTTPLTYSLLSKAAGGRVSPVKIQNLAKGVLSQSEPMVTAATDVLAKPLLGESAPVKTTRTARSNPFNPASAFVAMDPPYRTKSEDEYYALRDRYEQAAADARTAETNQDASVIERIVDRGDAALVADDTAKDLFRAADRQLKEMRDTRAEIQAAAKQGADPDAVREALDQLTRQQQALYRDVMAAWQTVQQAPTGDKVAAR